jgi:hypothetical protein
MPLLHKPVFALMGLSAAYLFVHHTETRRPLLFLPLLAVPIFASLYGLGAIQGDGVKGAAITWTPGFAIHDRLTLMEFVKFWSWNFGLHFILAPMSIVFAPSRLRRALWPCVGAFVLGFCFRYTDDVLVNHKFFNFILVFLGIATAAALVRAWDRWRISRPVVLLALVPLTLSGVINLFAQWNEERVAIRDVGNDPAATWIAQSTPRDAVFLNAVYLYDAASLAGRRIFLGYAYFVTSEGHDHSARRAIVERILATKSESSLCQLLDENGIDYVEVQDASVSSELLPVKRRALWGDDRRLAEENGRSRGGDEDFIVERFVPVFDGSPRIFRICR